MTSSTGSKEEIIKNLKRAKTILHQIIETQKQGDNISAIRKSKLARTYLKKADKLLIHQHLEKCIGRKEGIVKQNLTEEVVKTFKYSNL